jgi:hypothetical protein
VGDMPFGCCMEWAHVISLGTEGAHMEAPGVGVVDD